MTSLIITIGLPGSGKSTWVRNYIAKTPMTVCVCKDDIRTMLAGGRYVFDKNQEMMVHEMSRRLVNDALGYELNVVVDETFLTREHRREMRLLRDRRQDKWGEVILFKGIYFPCAPALAMDRRRADRKNQDIDWDPIIERMADRIEHPTVEEFDVYEEK